MKLSFPTFALFAVVLTLLLPTSKSQSQLALAPTDPLAQIQAMESANDDLLKRQDTTLKDLTEMTDTANEVRIFARRG